MPKSRPGQSGKLKFDPAKVQVTTLAILFLGVGVGLFVAPSIVGPIFSIAYKSGARSYSGFALTDEINGGIYSNSERLGDTTPSAQASFIASGLGASVNDNLKQYAQDLIASGVMERIFYGASILKNGGALDDTSAVADAVSSLREPASGFRPTSNQGASIRSTFFALETMKILGTYEEFAANEADFATVKTFVEAQKRDDDGFSDYGGAVSTIDATYHALQILGDSEALENTEDFVASCARIDGGFREVPAKDAGFATETSDATSTAKGLIILKRAKNSAFGPASLYLRGCVTTSGVVSSVGAKDVSIQANYYFLEAADLGVADYGLPLSLLNVLPAFGLVLIAAGVANLYSGQISASALATVREQVTNSAILLVVGAVAAQLLPQLAIPIYLALGFQTTMSAYKASDMSTETWTVVLLDAVLFMIGVFGLQSSSPLIFADLYAYPILLSWVLFGTIVVSMGANYIAEKKMNDEVFIKAAYLGGLVNVILFFGTLYGRDDTQTLSRLIQLRGLFPFIFVATPVLTVLLSYAGAALGLVYRF